ncbi:MAG: hypothetical protein ABI406_12985 [Ktedonobacteraceae bacterium]
MFTQIHVSQLSPSIDTFASYAISPIEPAQVTMLHAHMSTGAQCSLLIPGHLPPSILAHPLFKDGYECSYTEIDFEEEEWIIPKLLNEVYRFLSDLFYEEAADFCPWTLGFLCGELANVAERDRTLALTAGAHARFLLALLPLERTPPWPLSLLFQARFLHDRALKAYRARVRVYREQGRSFAEAQRLALVANVSRR